MENVKTIKGVDDDTWKKFRDLSIRNNLKMSLLLKMMVDKFEAEGRNFWREILSGEKNLTDEEAEDMLKIVNESRKEYGFRE